MLDASCSPTGCTAEDGNFLIFLFRISGRRCFLAGALGLFGFGRKFGSGFAVGGFFRQPQRFQSCAARRDFGAFLFDNVLDGLFTLFGGAEDCLRTGGGFSGHGSSYHTFAPGIARAARFVRREIKILVTAHAGTHIPCPDMWTKNIQKITLM